MNLQKEMPKFYAKHVAPTKKPWKIFELIKLEQEIRAMERAGFFTIKL